MEDILLIDKPVGMTSFDVIRTLRKRYGVRKMGHAGTLDPAASGLLIVGVGEGTKTLDTFLKLPKTYEARVLLGEATDTADADGAVVEEAPISACDTAEVREALAGMVGTLTLPVPRFAAIKQNGEPLYKKARRGEAFEPPVRSMEVRAAELRGIERHGDRCVLDVVFDVASGVYVRSLAVELGRRLGVPARLDGLRRTQIGEYSVRDAELLHKEE